MVSLDSGVRPTLDELKEVFDTDQSNEGIADAGLKAYLNAAHEVVQDVENSTSDSIDSSTLEKMEKFLAAHFASAQDPRIETERVADARFKYQRVDDGAGSDYWQIAVALDPTGGLAGAVKGRASFETFGPGR